MLLKVFFTLLFFVTENRANPVGELKPDECKAALLEAGVTEDFDVMVSHAIHSITMKELQKFDSTVTEDNYVPTVNYDLRADQAILPYAPDRRMPDDDMFVTEPMRTLNMVLSHMDDAHWDITAFNPLERVVHAFHMREVWGRARLQYNQITANPPNATVCQCALDVNNNGIMKLLRFTAMAIREPALVYGSPAFTDKTLDEKGQPKYYIPYPYSFHFLKPVENKNPEELFIRDHAQAMPPLTNSTVWKIWKQTTHSPKIDFDTALFIYCAINKSKIN